MHKKVYHLPVWLLAIAGMVGLGHLTATKAQAIVILPALLLIPIAKIVAVVVAALAVPSTTLGVVWAKLFRTSTKRTVIVCLVLMVVVAILVTLGLKMANPDRPWI